MKTFLTVVLVLILAGGSAAYYYWQNTNGATTTYRTATVERGNLSATISATGTIEPEEVIDIGAQVAGQIKNFGVDPRDKTKTIDYGSPVEDGTVLAQLDDALFKARVDQARAALQQAEAGLQQAEADMQTMQSKFRQSERDWERGKKLGPAGAVSGLDYDTIRSTYETSKAALGQGEAGIARAKANITQARAAFQEAETNLGYTTIKSPVKGVIVDRRVNVGQTVVASLNAPSLFLIAKDLKRLQVWASVNEADIGQIHAGQAVRFTVDAYPEEVFKGEVAQIRLNASMTQNVVTYTVVVNTDNSNGKLLPYLTANLHFEISNRSNVLLVPSTALRWRPQAQQVAPDAREAFLKSLRRRADKNPADKAAAKAEKERQAHGTLWVEDNGFVRPVKVRVGLSDGLMTEVSGEGLDDGTDVVVGEVRQNNGGGTTNPFTPQMFGGKKAAQ
jgi:HlyD family secretion protein